MGAAFSGEDPGDAASATPTASCDHGAMAYPVLRDVTSYDFMGWHVPSFQYFVVTLPIGGARILCWQQDDSSYWVWCAKIKKWRHIWVNSADHGAMVAMVDLGSIPPPEKWDEHVFAHWDVKSCQYWEVILPIGGLKMVFWQHTPRSYWVWCAWREYWVHIRAVYLADADMTTEGETEGEPMADVDSMMPQGFRGRW